MILYSLLLLIIFSSNVLRLARRFCQSILKALLEVLQPWPTGSLHGWLLWLRPCCCLGVLEVLLLPILSTFKWQMIIMYLSIVFVIVFVTDCSSWHLLQEPFLFTCLCVLSPWHLRPVWFLKPRGKLWRRYNGPSDDDLFLLLLFIAYISPIFSYFVSIIFVVHSLLTILFWCIKYVNKQM